MASQFSVNNAFSAFTLKNQFKAITGATVYIGNQDEDPLNPLQQQTVSIRNESGDFVPVPQPISINSGGFMTYNGQNYEFFTAKPFSIVILNNLGAELWRMSSVATLSGYDYAGTDAELFAQAGIVPNGQPDKLGASQRVEALHSLFDTFGTVTDLADGKFQVGKRVSVTDRAGGVFMVTLGGTPNGYDILDAGDGNTAVLLLDRPIPEHFGAKSGTSYDSSDAIEKWLNCNYGTLYSHGNNYKITRTLDATESTFKRLVADGTTLFTEFGALVSETVVIHLAERPSGQPYIEKLYFDALDPDSPESETLNTGETFNWTAKSWLVCMYLSEGVTLDECRFYRHKLPYRINGVPGDTFKRGTKTRVNGCWHVECRAAGGTTGSGVITLCDSVEIENNYYWLGGEATFPSNRRISISDNIVFIPGTPAIDVGGSASAVTDTVKITDNISFGRDPIVCELGARITLISGNICIVTSNNPSGVGIGVTSDFAGGQEIDTLKIEGNQISHYNDLGASQQYTNGIKVNANSNTIARVDVTNNTVYGARVGFQVDSNATDCDISNNNGYQVFRGAVLNCSGTANRNKFTSLGGLPQASGYGIGVFSGGTMKLSDNDTVNFEKDYRFEGALDKYQLIRPIHDKTDISNVFTLVNHSGFLFFDQVRVGGADPFLANYKRGSTKISTAPTAGGYYAFIAVGNGGPMKGYGAIQA